MKRATFDNPTQVCNNSAQVSLYITLWLVLLGSSNSLLKVIEPSSLVGVLGSQSNLTHRPLNFGWINYQLTTTVRLLEWPPSIGCNRSFDRDHSDFRNLKDQIKGITGAFIVLFSNAQSCSPITGSILAREIGAESGLLPVDSEKMASLEVNDGGFLKGKDLSYLRICEISSNKHRATKSSSTYI